MSRPDGRGDDGLMHEAAAWFARMRAPDADASRAEFEAWLARGALHRAAYNRAAEIFAMGKFLADESRPKAARSSPMPRRSWAFLATAAMLLLLVGSSWLALQLTRSGGIGGLTGSRRASSNQEAQIVARGEPQSVRLGDGSLVQLAAGARIAVEFNADLRRLTLDSGTARFFVAHESRPFQVDAGGGTVTARGTIFEVRLGAGRRVMVRLIEGTVDVQPPLRPGATANGAHAVRLQRGQATEFTSAPAAGAAGSSSGIDPSDGAAAATVVRDYDSIRIADLVRLANATAQRPIRLCDPKLGELRISGTFRIDDTGLLATRIGALFDLIVDQRDPREILIRGK